FRDAAVAALCVVSLRVALPIWAERFDDRVLARVEAGGRRVAVVGVAAVVAGNPVVGAGRADRDRRRGVVHPAGVSDRLGHVAAGSDETAGVAVELGGERAGRVA